MVISSTKKGFSLIEILVATIVMSMIMVGVLAFVQYGGEIWHRGQNKISIQNYNNMAFQLLKDDLLQAEKVISPKKISRTKAYPYKSISYKIGGSTYKVRIASGTLQREELNSSKEIITTRLARNAKAFVVYRISTWTFDVSLQIQAEKNINSDYEDDNLSLEDEDDEESLLSLTSTAGSEPEIVSSETMTLIAPGV